MKPGVRQGLTFVVSLLDQRVGVEPSENQIRETIAWIELQLALDGRRRKPRGKYGRRPGES